LEHQTRFDSRNVIIRSLEGILLPDLFEISEGKKVFDIAISFYLIKMMIFFIVFEKSIN
jgi:hypothetical protein